MSKLVNLILVICLCNSWMELTPKYIKLCGIFFWTFDIKRGVMRCAQAVIKNAPKKKYSKKIKLSSV